jgi:hypothetical protein
MEIKDFCFPSSAYNLFYIYSYQLQKLRLAFQACMHYYSKRSERKKCMEPLKVNNENKVYIHNLDYDFWLTTKTKLASNSNRF